MALKLPPQFTQEHTHGCDPFKGMNVYGRADFRPKVEMEVENQCNRAQPDCTLRKNCGL